MPPIHVRKICPIIVQICAGVPSILAFRHPLVGNQFVKGTIEEGETNACACQRELVEESGIDALVSINYLGESDEIVEEQRWILMHCEARALKPAWVFHTKDGGGLDFSFFWHPLHQTLDNQWPELFHRMFEHLKANYLDEILNKPLVQVSQK